MHKPWAIAAAATFTFISSPALAQQLGQFGSQGDAALSVERLFGINFTHVYEELDPPQGPNDDDEVEDDYVGLSFGWRGPYAPQYSPFDTPRLAFDYFILDRVNVGGSIAYATGKDDSEDFIDGNTPPAPGPSDYTTFLFAPRAGYAVMFADAVGIWPRGGITYHYYSVDGWYSEDGLALTLEAMFVIAPIQHLGILIGPTFDIDLVGGRDYDIGPATGVKRTYRSIGLQIGLLGWM